MSALDSAGYYMERMLSFRKPLGGHSLNLWDIFILRRLTWTALMAAGAPLAYCRKALNAKKKQASMQLEQVNIDSYKDRFNTLLLVSTLIATIDGTATTGDHSHQSKEEMISTEIFPCLIYLICWSIELFFSFCLPLVSYVGI